MLNHLPRYENKYFNCIQSQIVSYCKHIGFPIEWLFYTSYERTADLREQFIEQNKSRWLYEGECLSPEELSLLHIEWHQTQVESFAEAEPLLMDVLGRGAFPILTCNLYDLPYKKLHYQKSSVKHRFIYAGREQQGGAATHYVLDDNASAMGDFIVQPLPDHLLKQTFENSDKRVFWLLFRQPPEEAVIRDQISRRLHDRIKEFPDDHRFYLEVDSLLDDREDALFEPGGMIDRLVNAFTLLAGSRYVFSRFLQYYGGFEVQASRFSDCSLQAEIITNTLVKFKLSRRVNRPSIRDKCIHLQQAELAAQTSLRQAIFESIEGRELRGSNAV
ncbi:hypothetical protein [Paenibacillus xylaniclasticus]|uniref:hypothetical protein n=1 Tax=Paenibacillus xylaniclasticus TaxID=588083 RepID=UPI000FD90787|nr:MULTISPECIES: hypothetical protein [Paenibacillus]GFN32205.1 hypothetical protein PCURB6_24650 [Paenibacillus curdlanolyticus]